MTLSAALSRLVAAVESLDAAARPVRAGCGRPLAADNVVSAEEVARELGCADRRARELLTRVPPLPTPGGARRWRWGDVLQALADQRPAAKPSRPRGTVLRLPPPADV